MVCLNHILLGLSWETKSVWFQFSPGPRERGSPSFASFFAPCLNYLSRSRRPTAPIRTLAFHPIQTSVARTLTPSSSRMGISTLRFPSGLYRREVNCRWKQSSFTIPKFFLSTIVQPHCPPGVTCPESINIRPNTQWSNFPNDQQLCCRGVESDPSCDGSFGPGGLLHQPDATRLRLRRLRLGHKRAFCL
jgi:hypothetical protein